MSNKIIPEEVLLALAVKGGGGGDVGDMTKAVYDGNDDGKVNSADVSDAVSMGEDGNIRFGIDGNGNYGYIKAGADTVTPFKNPTGNKAIPQITQNGTVTGIDVEDYATASLDIAVPAPAHTETYTPAANTAANDMGASHGYRYVNTSGMVVPSGTKSDTYPANGTYSVDVSGKATHKVIVNVPDAYLNKIKTSFTIEDNDNTYRMVNGSYIWTDGDNIYHSSGSYQYVLDRNTYVWAKKNMEWVNLSYRQ